MSDTDSSLAGAKERRRFHRVPFDVSCEISSGAGSWISEVCDISLRGILVAEPEGWVPSEECQILLRLSPEVDIRMSCTPAHQGDGYLGFKMSQTDTESLATLRRLLELNICDAAEVDRELNQMVAAAA